MQFPVEDSGDEGLSEREFAMTVIYRINLHLTKVVRYSSLTTTTEGSFTVIT